MEASKPPLPDEAPISNDSSETGLWLWHGAAPSPQPAPPVRSSWRIERVATLIISTARSARWLVLPSAWALVALAAFVAAHLLSGGQSMPGEMSVALPQPAPMAPAPSLAGPISPAPPPPPLTEPSLDQVQAPLAPVPQAMAERTQHKTAKWRARHRSHALFARSSTPVFVEPCRYQCDSTEATAWHGGGY